MRQSYHKIFMQEFYAKSNLGDNQGAIADYNQAAQLYLQQNKMSDYQDALDRVKKLEK